MTDKPEIHHEISVPDKDGNVIHRVSIRGNIPLKDLFGSRFQQDLVAKIQQPRTHHHGESHD